jgi:hypothetical protein
MLTAHAHRITCQYIMPWDTFITDCRGNETKSGWSCCRIDRCMQHVTSTCPSLFLLLYNILNVCRRPLINEKSGNLPSRHPAKSWFVKKLGFARMHWCEALWPCFPNTSSWTKNIISNLCLMFSKTGNRPSQSPANRTKICWSWVTRKMLLSYNVNEVS